MANGVFHVARVNCPPTGTFVFLLSHDRPVVGDDEATESKLLGCFLDRSSAQAAIVNYLDVVGFVDYPDAYVIEQLPLDETLHNPDESGVTALARQLVEHAGDLPESELAALDPGTGARTTGVAVVDELCRLGTSAIFNLIEAIPDHASTTSRAEEIQRALLVVWWPHRRFTGESDDGFDPASTAALFWEYRRRGYPDGPEWESAEYLSWREQSASHRRVALLEDLDDAQVLALVLELLSGVETADEREFILLGPMTGWLKGAQRLDRVLPALQFTATSNNDFKRLLTAWLTRASN